MNSPPPNFSWPLQHDLPATVRNTTIALLNRSLADAIDLGLQAKQAHWNVKGRQFVSLHALFDEAAIELAALTDELAERVVALGGIAQGTLRIVSEQTRLEAYPPNLLTGTAHLRALSAVLGSFAKTTRAAIDAAATAGDATTADVFTAASRSADKLLWKCTAHLEDAP
jgi:starvation-inducible DNA-binding protein